MSVHPYKCSNVLVEEDIAVKSEEIGHKFSVLKLM
jgi:hypothetical protein